MRKKFSLSELDERQVQKWLAVIMGVVGLVVIYFITK